jgi:hypothetical protein
VISRPGLHVIAMAGLVGNAAICAGQSGRLEGTVTDSSGAVAPYSVISGVQQDTGFRFAVESDSRGIYSLTLPKGSYNLVARRSGFRTIARSAITVGQNATTTVNFQLEPGSVFETVTVSDTAGLEHDERALDAPSATRIRPDDEESLPLSDRTVSGLLALAPGLLITPANGGEPGQISDLGARPNTNRYTVDGVSGNSAVSGGGWPSLLGGSRLPAMTAFGTTHDLAILESIDEVRVTTQGDTPAAGRAPGANIAIQTKSGSNNFHGSIYYGSRPGPLSAKDWFSDFYPTATGEPAFSDVAGSMGGRIRRNRTFFFLSAEKLDLRQVYSWTTTVPSLAYRALAPVELSSILDQFPLPNGPPLKDSFGLGELVGTSSRPGGLTSGSARLDQILSSHTRAFARYALTPSWLESGYTQINVADYRNTVGVFGLTRDSPHWTQDLRVSFSSIAAVSWWVPPMTQSGPGDFY